MCVAINALTNGRKVGKLPSASGTDLFCKAISQTQTSVPMTKTQNKNSEFKTQNSTQNSGSELTQLNSELRLRIQDWELEFRIQDAELKTQNSRLRTQTQNSRLRTQNSEFKTQNSNSELRLRILNSEFKLRTQTQNSDLEFNTQKIWYPEDSFPSFPARTKQRACPVITQQKKLCTPDYWRKSLTPRKSQRMCTTVISEPHNVYTMIRSIFSHRKHSWSLRCLWMVSLPQPAIMKGNSTVDKPEFLTDRQIDISELFGLSLADKLPLQELSLFWRPVDGLWGNLCLAPQHA